MTTDNGYALLEDNTQYSKANSIHVRNKIHELFVQNVWTISLNIKNFDVTLPNFALGSVPSIM